MRKRVAIFAVALLTAVVAAPAVAEELAVLDVLRGVAVNESNVIVEQAPCQDQICKWVDAVPGNPAHFNCGTQTNCKCDPADPPVTCENGVCRQPKTTTPQTQAGEL